MKTITVENPLFLKGSGAPFLYYDNYLLLSLLYVFLFLKQTFDVAFVKKDFSSPRPVSRYYHYSSMVHNILF